MALDVRELDGFKRFGPCTYPHVEISSKFEALGPRNGRGRTSSNPLKVKLFRLRRGLQHLRPSKFHGFFAVPFSLSVLTLRSPPSDTGPFTTTSSVKVGFYHPGELVAKVGYFGVKSAKVCRAQMGTKPAKVGRLGPRCAKVRRGPQDPHRRAPPQKGLRSTPRAKLLKSAPRADQSC